MNGETKQWFKPGLFADLSGVLLRRAVPGPPQAGVDTLVSNCDINATLADSFGSVRSGISLWNDGPSLLAVGEGESCEAPVCMEYAAEDSYACGARFTKAGGSSTITD